MTTKKTDDLDLDELEALTSGASEKKEVADEGLSPIHAFEIDVTDYRGKRWSGRFVFRVPTLGDQVKIARLKAALLPAGAAPDPNGGLLAEMMAYTQVCFSERPNWWKPERFYDPLPLITAYKEARMYERRFLGADATDAGGDEGSDGGGSDPADQGHVG